MLIVIAFADAITLIICPSPLLPSTAFLSLWPPHKFSFRLLKYFDPTALPPRHGSYVLIRAPLLGVRTASDLCCRDLLTEVSRFLVHTLCYYYVSSFPLRCSLSLLSRQRCKKKKQKRRKKEGKKKKKKKPCSNGSTHNTFSRRGALPEMD